PAFQTRQVQTHAPVMVEHARRMLEGWRAGQTRMLTEDLLRLTLAITTQTLFGVDIENEALHLRPIVGDVLAYFGSPIHSLILPSWVPTPAALRSRRAVRLLDDLIARHTREAGARPGEEHGGPELIRRLLAARDDDGSGMTERQLRDELITIGFAGH